MPTTSSSKNGKNDVAIREGTKEDKNPVGSKFKLVVKRRHRRKPKHSSSSCAKRVLVVKVKPGLPNFPTELKEPPKDDDENDDDDDEFDDLFPNLEDAIPCDTLLAFQSLTQPPQQQQQQQQSAANNPKQQPPPPQKRFLEIPLQASLDPIPCVLESQIIQVLNNNNNNNNNNDDDNDDNGFALVTREIPELIRKNTLRRFTSITTPGGGGGTFIEVLLLTSDYIRGVWDAHDMYTTTTSTEKVDGEGTTTTAPPPSEEERELQQCYIQWFVDHLYRFVGRVITESQLEGIWNKYPPIHTLPYAMVVVSLKRAIDYYQKLQIIMVAGGQQRAEESTFQLWLPSWGKIVLSSLQKAQTKLIRKLQQTYQKEIAEKTILQQQQYHGIPVRLLLQLMLDQGKIKVVPKPYGNFIKLILQNKTDDSTKGNKKKR